MRRTMFLNNITAIDHAYIDNLGMVVGGAVNPTMTVSGLVDPVENVVVDFSNVKKKIKEIIDDKDNGYDHKLWIIHGYSQCEVEDHVDFFVIKTDAVTLTLPRNAVKQIVIPVVNNDYSAAVIDQMEQELEIELNMHYEGVDLQVTIDFDASFIGCSGMDTPMIPFRYVHGLKSSTSWGCQNIAHGHLSYLAASTDKPLETEMLLQQIAAELDKRVFVWMDNMPMVEDQTNIALEYETVRGKFKMNVGIENVVLLETETTVEHIASFVTDVFSESLKEAGVKRLFVSEGLNKGASVEI